MSDKSNESENKKILSFFIDKIKELKRIIGIVDKKEPISFELSEFMQETESALQELPQNYKNLYELKPAKEYFFVNRKNEIEKLEKSFTNWTKNRFVTCALIAEKGCGVTSTLNAFLEKIPQTDTIISEINEKIYTKESYFAFFNSILNTQFTTNKELIDFLNNSQSAKIIIIKNLHHMFLKKVGGFESIKLLFELISYTTKKVLWIGIFTPATWNYLDKTISISNYFTSEIAMERLSHEIIKEILLQRNKYEDIAIKFIPQEDTLKSKIFEKLDDDEKQSYLEERFFNMLNKLSHGNISLALLYWIRAIDKIDKQTIFIKEIEDLDYSFLKNLSPMALFTLQALILHDGLMLHDYAIVMDESAEECRKMLMPMLEKGLLIQPNKKYNINPAIYKQVHDYLSSKNFIH